MLLSVHSHLPQIFCCALVPCAFVLKTIKTVSKKQKEINLTGINTGFPKINNYGTITRIDDFFSLIL
jgi:hypothetical protein